MNTKLKGLLWGMILGFCIAVSMVYATNFQVIEADFPIIINGQKWETDKPVVTIDGSTYLPLRATGEVLDVNVDWNEEKRQVEISEKDYFPDWQGTKGNPIDVSLIDLMVMPERFMGKYVRIIAVGFLEFESDSLFLTKDDLKYGTGNYIGFRWGHKTEENYEKYKQYNGEYVIVVCRVEYGGLTDIIEYRPRTFQMSEEDIEKSKKPLSY